jgi:clan AA aspartic protease
MVVRRRGSRVGYIHLPVTIRAVSTAPDAYQADFLIDTGAIDSMAPGAALRLAGIQPIGTRIYELADGSHHEYAFGVAQLEFLGEITGGRVIFGPDGIEPLLGVTALESAGLTIDPSTQTLRKVRLRL